MKNKPKTVLSSGLIAILFSIVNIYANAEPTILIKDKDIGKKLVCKITEENLHSTGKISYKYVNVNSETLLNSLVINRPQKKTIYETSDHLYIFYEGNGERGSIVRTRENTNIRDYVINGELNESYGLKIFEDQPHLERGEYNLWLRINSDQSISTNFGKVQADVPVSGMKSVYYNPDDQLIQVNGDMKEIALRGRDHGYISTGFSFTYMSSDLWLITGSPIKNFSLIHKPIKCRISNSIHVEAAGGETQTGE